MQPSRNVYADFVDRLSAITEFPQQVSEHLSSHQGCKIRLIQEGVDVESYNWLKTAMVANEALKLVGQDYATKLIGRIREGYTHETNAIIRSFALIALLKRFYPDPDVAAMIAKIPGDNQRFALATLLQKVPDDDKPFVIARTIELCSALNVSSTLKLMGQIQPLDPHERADILKWTLFLKSDLMNSINLGEILNQIARAPKEERKEIAEEATKAFAGKSCSECVKALAAIVDRKQVDTGYF